jgi:hypothetical protein
MTTIPMTATPNVSHRPRLSSLLTTDLFVGPTLTEGNAPVQVCEGRLLCPAGRGGPEVRAVDLSGHAAGATLYVAVRYNERPERPVPTPQGEQHARIRETLAVEVLIRPPRQKPWSS